jgi:acyl-CoA thioester hydrolase
VFEHKLRVRYAETDKMGVVYYANFFIYFEEARGAHLRSIGYSYSALEEKGYFTPVKEAFCEYLSPAYYEDILTIKLKVEILREASFKYIYEVERGDKLVARGYTIHVLVNKELKPVRIPDGLKRALTGDN